MNILIINLVYSETRFFNSWTTFSLLVSEFILKGDFVITAMIAIDDISVE